MIECRGEKEANETRNSSRIPSLRSNLRLRETFRDALDGGEMHVEVCSKCHPFYTGTQRLVDTAGRMERFNRKYGS